MLIAEEEQPSGAESYPALVSRLSRLSVQKHYLAFRDVDWDAPEMRIDPTDPRWELLPTDPLGSTEWYRGQPPAERARIGLYRVASFMKIGVQFENVLSRGLLEFALGRGNRSPEFRYAYHETIEESQHSLMFQEFVDRTGFDLQGVEGPLGRLDGLVVGLGRRFPELFFLFVLGGEDPIDFGQRRALRERDLHPLLRRISQIHVTEEARHLCFARAFLAEHVPRLSPARRTALGLLAPAALRLTAELMLRPSRSLVREFHIPQTVMRQAFADNPVFRQLTFESLGKVHKVCQELGLIDRRTAWAWRGLGLS